MTTEKQYQAAKPTHRVYSVTGKGKQSNWTPIGAAWPNRDGAGFALSLDAIPVNGARILMREIGEAVEMGGQQ